MSFLVSQEFFLVSQELERARLNSTLLTCFLVTADSDAVEHGKKDSVPSAPLSLQIGW